MDDRFFKWLELVMPRLQAEADRRGRDVTDLAVETFDIAVETIESEKWDES